MAKYPKYRDDDWDVPLKQYIDSFMGSAENVRLAREQIEATTRDLLAMYGATSGVENSAALAPFRAIDTSAQTARVVLIGDSISDGGMSSTYGGTISMRLQASLREALGRTGGYGYVSATPSTQGAIVPNVPNTRVGTAVMWSHGLGGRAMYLGEANHHVTYSAQQFTQIKVYYGKTTIAGGGLKIEFGDANGQNFVDQGVVLTSAAPVGEGNSSGHVWTSPVLGMSHRTVRITSFAPPYVGILEGVEFINGDEASGLRVYNGAHSGGSVTAFNQASMDLHWQALAQINPHLTIVNLGTNDVAALTPAQFLSGMATLIGKIPSLSRVLLVGNYLRGDYNTPAGRDKWQQMQAGLREMATGRVAYINLAPHWPELQADGSTSEGLMFDTPPIHPNDAGMKKISDVLVAAVGPTSNLAFVGPRGPKGPMGDLTPASQTILNDAVADVVAAAADAEAARDEAAGLLVSSSSLTLSAANPTVPALSNVNEWTVSNPVQVVLPLVNPGSQYTVHVTSGFHDLSWPNGTEVFGTTTEDEDVWLTLVRDTDRWKVLVSSQKPGGGGGGPALDEPLATNLFPNPRPTGPTPLVRYGTYDGDTVNNVYEASMHYDVPGGGVRFTPTNASGRACFKLPNLITDGRKYLIRFSYMIIADSTEAGDHQFTSWKGPGKSNLPLEAPIYVTNGQMSRISPLFAKPEHQERWIRSFPISITVPAGNAASDWWLTVAIGYREIAIRDFTVIDTTTGYELRDAFHPDVDSGAVWDGTPGDSPSSLYNIRRADAEWMAQHEVAHYVTPFGTPMDDPEFVEATPYPRGAVVSQPHLVSGSSPNPIVTRYSNAYGGATGGWRNYSSGDGTLGFLLAFGGNENWTAGNPITEFASEDWSYVDGGGGMGMVEINGQMESGSVTMHFAGVSPTVENPAGAIFTLPLGMRPVYPQGAYVRTVNDVMVYLEIMPTGEVFVRSPMAVGDALGKTGTSKEYVALQWRMK